jgi:endonuclease YncB( thermonuclease family)
MEFTGKCVGVMDGDTISVMRDRKEVRVRLWGIDAPEKKQAYGILSKHYTSKLLFGKVVRVVVMDTDQYGRIVGKVYLNGEYGKKGTVRASVRMSRVFYFFNIIKG